MKYKILVVEDNKEDATQLINTCHQAGFQTSQADSGEKALEMVWTWKPDMLLLDLALPGINGKEVCRILRDDERGRTHDSEHFHDRLAFFLQPVLSLVVEPNHRVVPELHLLHRQMASFLSRRCQTKPPLA